MLCRLARCASVQISETGAHPWLVYAFGVEDARLGCEGEERDEQGACRVPSGYRQEFPTLRSPAGARQ